MACPIEIIDMGFVDTRAAARPMGPAEQYAERREESALRRSGRVVPIALSRRGCPSTSARRDDPHRPAYDPRRMLAIMQRTQAEYGHLPVAALQHIATPPAPVTADLWHRHSYRTALEPGWRPRSASVAADLPDARGGRVCAALEERCRPMSAASARWRRALVAIDCGGESTPRHGVDQRPPQKSADPIKLANLPASCAPSPRRHRHRKRGPSHGDPARPAPCRDPARPGLRYEPDGR